MSRTDDVTPRDFLTALLISNPPKGPIVSQLGENGNRLAFDVNITVSEAIAPSFPVQTPGQQVGIREQRIGKFPLANIRVRAESDDPPVQGSVAWRDPLSADVYFPSSSRRYVADIEWRRVDTNDVLFRVEEVEIEVS